MRINEIFESIDGEVNGCGQGRLTTFIRLDGCNLKCEYCDTPEAQGNSKLIKSMSVKAVKTLIINTGNKNVTITGGEPLLQQNEIVKLIEVLPDDYKIVIETNGTINPCEKLITKTNICWVVDYKLLPITQFAFDIRQLEDRDIIKFVVNNKDDLFSTLFEIQNFKTYFHDPETLPFKIAISPNLQEISADDVIRYLHEYKMFDVIVNIQIHKLLNLK